MKLELTPVVSLLNRLDYDIRMLLDSALPNKQQHTAVVRLMEEKFNAARDMVTTYSPRGILIQEDGDQVDARAEA